MLWAQGERLAARKRLGTKVLGWKVGKVATALVKAKEMYEGRIKGLLTMTFP